MVTRDEAKAVLRRPLKFGDLEQIAALKVLEVPDRPKYECLACEGEGTVDCEECHGTGEVFDEEDE